MNAQRTIMLVEDEPAIFYSIQPYAEHEGYRLDWVRSVAEAEESLAKAERPNIVLLDRGLPVRSGDTLAAGLRAAGIPFILVTARGSESERLTGFDLGADDYVVKPFSAAELLRRVDVVLRRRGRSRFSLGDAVELDADSRSVSVRGKSVSLTRSEFDLLVTLAQGRGRVFTRSELADRLHLDLETSERALDSHAKNLRRKLREAGATDPIETVIGIGYVVRDAS
jgi:DNA-binding response OmpR family regulator